MELENHFGYLQHPGYLEVPHVRDIDIYLYKLFSSRKKINLLYMILFISIARNGIVHVVTGILPYPIL